MQPTSFSSWYAPITAVALPLAAAWILFIGLSAASYRLANSRFAVTANDERWVDVSDEASNLRSRTRRVRTGRILELTGVALILWSAVLVFTAIALPWPILLGLLTTFAARKFGPYLAFAFVVGTWGAFAVSPEPSRQALLMLAIATWIYILGRRWTRRKYPAYRRGVDQPTLDDWLPAPGIEWRRPWGRAIAGSTVVGLLTVGLLYTYAAAKWAAIAGAGELQSVISTARALPLGNLFWWRVLVVVIATARFGTAELLLISGMAAIYLLNGLVLRLWAPDPWDVISRQDPRAFVYLRNFGDDRTRIRAGTYTRVPFLQVIFDVLVPVRRRPFEQVMASLLARHGPVIGAADPRVSGRRVGVLKVALPHQSWSTDVTQWCESAIAVVISATPATIQDGLREELKLLSSKISHQRIILILGPGKQDDLRRRFADFKAAWPAGSPLLDGLDDERAVSGTLVMVRVPGKGWDCWGSPARTESAYAVALAQAIEYGDTVWNADPERATIESLIRPAAGPPSVGVRAPAAPIVVAVSGRPTGSNGFQIVTAEGDLRRAPSLGMTFDGEAPEPIGDETVLGYWSGSVVGSDGLTVPTWRMAARDHTTASLCVTEHRLYGVIRRMEAGEELWLCQLRNTVTAHVVHQDGIPKSSSAEIVGNGWRLTLGDVDEIFRRSGSFQTNRAKSLVKAMSGPVPLGPVPSVPAAAPVDGQWVEDPGSGIYLQVEAGSRTGASCLADPRRPSDRQSEHIRSMLWLPSNIIETEARRAEGGHLRPRILAGVHATDSGRIANPFNWPSLAIANPGDEGQRELRGYLWPIVDGALDPVLDVAESVLLEWSTASPIGHWLDDDLGLKLPLLNIVPKEVSHSVQWLLTDRRVVMLARGRSRFATGVLHVRFEWMSGVITERYADRAGKRKPTASIDVMIGNTEGQQFSLPINPGSDGVQGERVLMALREALSRSHLELGEARHRNSGGKHGTLARDFRPVPGVGPGIPTTLLGTLGG